MWPIAKESETEESRQRGAGISDNDQANWSYMSNTENLSLAEIEDLSLSALMAVGTSEANAHPLAVATAATEAAGVASHGQATPIINQTRPSVVTLDAATGFAHSAIEQGFEQLTPLTRIQGIAALAVKNSYNCGILGYHTYRLAQAGLLGIGWR